MHSSLARSSISSAGRASNGPHGRYLVPPGSVPVASTSREPLNGVRAPAPVNVSQHATDTSTGSPRRMRRVGRLGIPIASDDEDEGDSDSRRGAVALGGQWTNNHRASTAMSDAESDSESLAANPSASLSPPPGTKAWTSVSGDHRAESSVPDWNTLDADGDIARSRARSKRSGSAGVSDAHFRDIVDELTIQNQKLKGRLKRYEAAHVPKDLRRERLFEVRFFEGLPPSQRREIETFLQSYVQNISSEPGSPLSIEPPYNQRAAEERTSGDPSASTSSIGAELRSLRESEKEALGFVSGGIYAPLQTADQLSGSGSGSGSGHRSSRRKRSFGVAQYNYAPLRHPLEPYDIEREMLAAPSNFGIEPESKTGTGAGMRISQPSSKRSHAQQSPSPYRRPSASNGTPRSGTALKPEGHRSKDSQYSRSREDEALAMHVTDLVELLFEESLPFSDHEGRLCDPPSPPNPLRSEPEPLPPLSHSNTHYLRELLKDEDLSGPSPWLYLNLVSTFAGLPRLSVSASFVRKAIANKSTKLEVSEDGAKVRWLGPRSRVISSLNAPAGAVPANAPRRAAEDIAVNEADSPMHTGKTTMVGSADTSADGSSASRDARRPHTVLTRQRTALESNGQSLSASSASRSNVKSESTNDDNHKASTAATSVSPVNSKALSGSRGSTSSVSVRAATQASTRSTERLEAIQPPLNIVDDRSIRADRDRGKSHIYTPLYSQLSHRSSSATNEAESSDGEDDAISEDGRQSKRRRVEGGLVFFATDIFCSDLAGDGAIREAMQQKANGSLRSSMQPTSSADEALKHLGSDNARVTDSDLYTSAPPSMEEHSSETSSTSGFTGADEGEDLVSFVASPAIEDCDNGRSNLFPLKTLRMSGMFDARASDHFSLIVTKRRRTQSLHISSSIGKTTPARPWPSEVLSSELLRHFPAVAVRIPRLRLVRDGSSSPSSSSEKLSEASARATQLDSPEGDYGLSLTLPLHTWAPQRVPLDETAAYGGEDEAISVD